MSLLLSSAKKHDGLSDICEGDEVDEAVPQKMALMSNETGMYYPVASESWDGAYCDPALHQEPSGIHSPDI